MKIKLFAMILFMVFMSIPAFAQSENDANSNKPVPTQISEKKEMGEQKKRII